MNYDNLTLTDKIVNANTMNLTPKEKMEVLLSDNPLETLKYILNGK